MLGLVSILSAATCCLCAVLLFRGYARNRVRLLFWSGLCFAGLTLSNLLVIVDLVLLPQIDLYLWRLGTAAVAMLVLLYGLVFTSHS